MRKKLEKIYMALIFILLYAPIVTLVVLSFNASKTRAKWGGFTLHWYRSLFANTEIMNALYTTLIIALLASAIATVLGTLACIGINSMSKKSRTVFMGITNIPMLNGEIVMGISLMLLFIICRIQLGFGTILMAHITFNVPYVILSVMPKLKQTNKSTYEAALDLGASPLYAFWKVIFPDIMPGVVSGFLLSFTMSLDDFVITYFTKGPGVDTLSTKIYAEVRKGIKPEMYSLSTILFVTVLLLLLLVNVNPSPKEEKEEAKEREAMAKKGIRFRITKRVVFRRILPIAMARHSVCFSAKAVYNASKLTVIHIYASFPGDLSRIDIQSVALENVVVDHSCQQVVCCTDCMEVTGEVKVDIFHWNNLCVSAACCSAFYTEDRSKRWLAKCNHCFFTDSGKSVYQTYRSCCFSFSCRCRVDGCNEDQFSILRIGVF